MRYHKRVYYYLMRYRAGELSEHDYEVEEARWVAADEALAVLTYREEQEVIELAKMRIQEMPA